MTACVTETAASGCGTVLGDDPILPLRASFFPVGRLPAESASLIEAAGHSRRLQLPMPVSLTTRERAHLKGRAHALEPTVQVGVGGLSDAVLVELERALTAHELIKVKVNGTDREARRALADAICARTDAAEVQRVGKIIVLWRPTPEERSGTVPD